jgi:hypothetical protein
MSHPRPLPPLAALNARFYYDAERDCLCYHGQNYLPPDYCGKPVVGVWQKDGYRFIRVIRVRWPVHRIVWAVCHQQDPYPLEIDHKDENKENNRIGNLRLATRGQNVHNIKASHAWHGIKGVEKRTDGWKAAVQIDGVKYDLGRYSTAELAHQAYISAKNTLAGQFSPYCETG